MWKLLKGVSKVTISTLKTTGNVAIKTGKITASTLKTTGNVAIKTGKLAISTLQTLDQVSKNLIVSSIPTELKEGIQQGKILIPRRIIKIALKEYLLQQEVTLVDLSIKQNLCSIVAITKKRGIAVKVRLALDIEEIVIKQIEAKETQVNLSGIDIKLVIVEPLSICGQGLGSEIIVWITDKIGFGVLGIDFLAENLRKMRMPGEIINIPLKEFNLSQEQQIYLKYIEYIRSVKFVEDALEVILSPPEWLLQMLTEEKLNPS